MCRAGVDVCTCLVFGRPALFGGSLLTLRLIANGLGILSPTVYSMTHG